MSASACWEEDTQSLSQSTAEQQQKQQVELEVEMVTHLLGCAAPPPLCWTVELGSVTRAPPPVSTLAALGSRQAAAASTQTNTHKHVKMKTEQYRQCAAVDRLASWLMLCQCPGC